MVNEMEHRITDLDVSKEFLESKGHTVHTATDGLEGLDILKNGVKIDIIFSDGNMPNMNGDNFVNTIKTDVKYFKYASIPIIGVGTFKGEGKKYLTEYYQKPFLITNLVESIKKYCIP